MRVDRAAARFENTKYHRFKQALARMRRMQFRRPIIQSRRDPCDWIAPAVATLSGISLDLDRLRRCCLYNVRCCIANPAVHDDR